MATYTDPELRDRIKAEVLAGDKGGRPGQWSARKAQLVARRYEAAGGGYRGARSPAQRSLSRWTAEDWGTASGSPSLSTGERYLPRAAREALTPDEYRRTSEAKAAALARGEQFSPQPADVAAKTRRYRGASAGKRSPSARGAKSSAPSPRAKSSAPSPRAKSLAPSPRAKSSAPSPRTKSSAPSPSTKAPRPPAKRRLRAQTRAGSWPEG